MRSLSPSQAASARRAPRCDAAGGGGAPGGQDRRPGNAAAANAPRRTRRVALIVRDRVVARYTLPDFFPDLNARDDATEGLEALENVPGAQPYRWQRSVLAGVERSLPRQRSAQPTPPPDGAEQPQAPPPPPLTEAIAPGPGSLALAGLTVVFYGAALALTLARGFVESVPAVMPPPGG